MRMSIKPKGKLGFIFLALAIVIGAVVAYTSGIAHERSATRIGYIGNNGWDNWSGAYELLDGKMRRTLHFGSNKYINLETITESGTLSIEMHDKSGNILFSKSDIGSAEHTISVDGDVVVTISANKHSGSFSIRQS